MATPGKEVHNPKTGQRLRFVRTAQSTNGEVLEMVSRYAPGSTEPPPHYHPAQREDFTVLEGRMQVRMNGTVRTLHTGDTLHVPPGTVHSMWNAGDGPAEVNWQVRPALETEHFFETTFGLAQDGKVNDHGLPNFWQSVKLASAYRHVFRMAKPSFGVQRVVFAICSPIAGLLGYRAKYPKYIGR